LNDIGRNFLLGNRKKIAKFLMSTFTCRSTFLYAPGFPSRKASRRGGGGYLDFCCLFQWYQFAGFLLYRGTAGRDSLNGDFFTLGFL
jgi:hypothetical protein